MVHRQDAYRARQKLSTGSFKIGSKVIKVIIIIRNQFIVTLFFWYLYCNENLTVILLEFICLVVI